MVNLKFEIHIHDSLKKKQNVCFSISNIILSLILCVWYHCCLLLIYYICLSYKVEAYRDTRENLIFQKLSFQPVTLGLILLMSKLPKSGSAIHLEMDWLSRSFVRRVVLMQFGKTLSNYVPLGTCDQNIDVVSSRPTRNTMGRRY